MYYKGDRIVCTERIARGLLRNGCQLGRKRETANFPRFN